MPRGAGGLAGGAPEGPRASRELFPGAGWNGRAGAWGLRAQQVCSAVLTLLPGSALRTDRSPGLLELLSAKARPQFPASPCTASWGERAPRAPPTPHPALCSLQHLPEPSEAPRGAPGSPGNPHPMSFWIAEGQPGCLGDRVRPSHLAPNC